MNSEKVRCALRAQIKKARQSRRALRLYMELDRRGGYQPPDGVQLHIWRAAISRPCGNNAVLRRKMRRKKMLRFNGTRGIIQVYLPRIAPCSGGNFAIEEGTL